MLITGFFSSFIFIFIFIGMQETAECYLVSLIKTGWVKLKSTIRSRTILYYIPATDSTTRSFELIFMFQSLSRIILAPASNKYLMVETALVTWLFRSSSFWSRIAESNRTITTFAKSSSLGNPLRVCMCGNASNSPASWT